VLQLSYTLQTIDEAVVQFWREAQSYNVIAFSGEMGAGKTTFISRLCRSLGVIDPVSSPTFSLVNEYRFADFAGVERTIYHLDWYRLKDTREAVDAGMEDCMERAARDKDYCIIEWPEKAFELLLPPYLQVSIASKGMDEREMTVALKRN
jgi:tRNA threonylcarbamoyladenosine biosynthesis protein TsaE